MPDTSLLAAAARAFAIVCLSDGRLARDEARRFVSFAADDAALGSPTADEIGAAWSRAVEEVEASTDFSEPIAAIAASARTTDARAAVMRAAQAATVADDHLKPQEETALRTIAEALSLDPEAY